MTAQSGEQLIAAPRLSVARIAPFILAAGLFAFFLSQAGIVAAGQDVRVAWNWVPSLDVRVSFLIDGLSLTFALLISGIGALVMLYSPSYLGEHPQYGRFALYLTSFMLSMLGLVLADNLVTLFVFWELTTVTSYLLIGFDHAGKKARRSALQAMLLTGTGGLCLLAAVILIGNVAGTFELSEIRTMGSVLVDSDLYLPIFILVALGAFTKSAQFPFHFWLPNAMAAPTPVSAYLHSATMVKAGVYLLARMHPSLSGTEVWLWTLTVFGAVTALFASIMAIRQTDLKLALAYTTLMALGTLTLFLGADVGYAITAAMTFLIVHSLYKAALFLIVGIIDHETGTRDVRALGGLAKAMPITATAAAISALSMAGFPPFIGFIGKELKYAGALAVTSEPVLVAGAVLLSNALMFTAAGIVAFRPFWRAPRPACRRAHEAPWPMVTGPALLALLGGIFGIMPVLLAEPLIDPAVTAVLGEPGEAAELKLWAGINLPLALSVATFVLGFALYAMHRRLRIALVRITSRAISFDSGWDRLLDGLRALAAWQTQVLQSGRLSRYLAITFATLLAAMLAGWFAGELSVPIPTIPDLALKHWLIVVLTIAGAGLSLVTRSRVAAIAGLGVVGIGVALIFIIYGAPDVAITQLLVETLIVVLFSAAALRLPTLPANGGIRWGHAALSVAIGAMAALILALVTIGPIDRRITTYFEEASWTEAFGRNIVNVVLVDFRALDTFGEIAVVVMAALGAFALLRGGTRTDPS